MRIRRRSKSPFQNRWKSEDLKYISKQKRSFGKAVREGPEPGASGILALAVLGVRHHGSRGRCWAEGLLPASARYIKGETRIWA